jgi:hypothetical protein
MPNSVADSNNVSWGEDSMSNIAAAVTAQTLGNMKGSAARTASIGRYLVLFWVLVLEKAAELLF